MTLAGFSPNHPHRRHRLVRLQRLQRVVALVTATALGLSPLVTPLTAAAADRTITPRSPVASKIQQAAARNRRGPAARRGSPVQPPQIKPNGPLAENAATPAPATTPATETVVTPGGAKGTADIATTGSAANTSGKVTKPEVAALGARAAEIQEARAKGDLKVTFKNADLLEVIQTISDRLSINFIIPENLRKAKVTILSPTAVTDQELWEAFLSILKVSKLTLVRTGAFYKIDNTRDTHSEPIPLIMGNDARLADDDQLVTWIFRLQYVDVQSVLPTIKTLSSKEGNVLSYNPTNTLIIIDSGSNLVKLKRIIDQLDQPGGTDELYIIDVKYASAEDITDKITTIFNVAGGKGGTGKKAAAPPPTPEGGAPASAEESVNVSKVIADTRTNKLIVITDKRSLDRIVALVRKLDVPIPGDGQVHVYTLKNTTAEDVSQTLAQLTGAAGAGAKAKGKGATAAPGASSVFEGTVKVTADKSTNSLVIVASQADYKSLKKVIESLDMPRMQVYVESVVMEVTLDRTRAAGFSVASGAMPNIGGQDIPLFFGTNYKNLNALTVNASSLASLFGFLGGVRGPEIAGSKDALGLPFNLPSFGALLNLLQTASDVNVLSTPHLLTTDNEEAEIIVGENVPFQSGFTSGIGGSALGSFNPIVSIQRQDVALKLKVKPQISTGDIVRLNINQEVSEVQSVDQLLGPTTSKRAAKTVVSVRDQQTIVIGGLVRDRTSETATKVPYLGDIPIIGFLFRSTETRSNKTNLLLMLTPYIIRGPEDFRKILERKLRERQEFIDKFYGGLKSEYNAYYDYEKSAGPLSRIKRSIDEEMERLENGGDGADDQLKVEPRVEGLTSNENLAGRKKETGPSTLLSPETVEGKDTDDGPYGGVSSLAAPAPEGVADAAPADAPAPEAPVAAEPPAAAEAPGPAVPEAGGE